VQTLNRYGAKVLACDIAEAPESVLSLQECKFVQANLADAGATEKIVEAPVASSGRIDGLLNIAGVIQGRHAHG
jgi:NADP-dependent 3-hydroxy acid dehydrogenase YdfG